MYHSFIVFFRLLLPLVVVVGLPVAVVETRDSAPVPVVDKVTGLWSRAVALSESRRIDSHGQDDRGGQAATMPASPASHSSAGGTSAGAAGQVALPVASDKRVDDQVQLRLADTQSRLEELGAQHMLLEAVEGETPRFRFQCLMPLPGSVFSRPFERIDVDPARAIERVLLEVIEWRQAWPEAADEHAVGEPDSA